MRDTTRLPRCPLASLTWGGLSRISRQVVERLGGKPHTIALNQRDWGGSVVIDGRYDLAPALLLRGINRAYPAVIAGPMRRRPRWCYPAASPQGAERNADDGRTRGA